MTDNDKQMAENYTKTVLFVNTSFFFNEILNLGRFRARVLFERAKRRMALKDPASAAVDSNEALNYDASLTECYLLKARAEAAKAEYSKVEVAER